MPAEDYPASRAHQEDGGISHGQQNAQKAAKPMTSRGTKYWSSGSIPLIGPDVLGGIISKASDVAIVISETGTVLSVLVNPDHRGFGKIEEWEGHDIREFLTIESVPKLDLQLQRFMEESDDVSAIELNHTDARILEFPIRYSFHVIGPDGAILMLGRDLRPVAEMQQQLVQAQMALERDYEAQREYDTRFRVLMEATTEAFVFVSHSSGRIVEISAAAAALFGGNVADMRGGSFAQEFDSRRRSELMANLVAQSMSDSQKPLELTTHRTKKTVQISPISFRAAGERTLLCRITTGAEEQAGGSDMADYLQSMFERGVEAIVFTDADGGIVTANEGFLNLIDASHTSRVTGRSLGDYLARGSVDLKVLIENARRVGQMRIYSTKLVSEFGGQVAVELSATWLDDDGSPSMVFVIRDASRAEAVRQSGPVIDDDSVQSVIELVGSATLKEIVSETNDVVEKKCIETAVELTRNNRVAAAEMLGLSRQSLYVKLRKYGLLARDSD